MVELQIWDNGVTVWYFNGLCHRDNGPAATLASGSKWWYWHDQAVTEYEHMMLSVQEITNG